MILFLKNLRFGLRTISVILFRNGTELMEKHHIQINLSDMLIIDRTAGTDIDAKV